jgi:hypothetical protein
LGCDQLTEFLTLQAIYGTIEMWVQVAEEGETAKVTITLTNDNQAHGRKNDNGSCQFLLGRISAAMLEQVMPLPCVSFG